MYVLNSIRMSFLPMAFFPMATLMRVAVRAAGALSVRVSHPYFGSTGAERFSKMNASSTSTRHVAGSGASLR
jgi:hypothetical protein